MDKDTTQTTNVNVTSKVSMPVKLLAAATLAGAAGFGGGQLTFGDSQKVEHVQVADANTEKKLDEILKAVTDTREKVIRIEGKVENIDHRLERVETDVERNDKAIREVEKRGQR